MVQRIVQRISDFTAIGQNEPCLPFTVFGSKYDAVVLNGRANPGLDAYGFRAADRASINRKNALRLLPQLAS